MQDLFVLENTFTLHYTFSTVKHRCQVHFLVAIIKKKKKTFNTKQIQGNLMKNIYLL